MISIFTPTHATSSPFLLEAWESLKAQTMQDFQWVIVTNNGGFVPESISADRRVKVIGLETQGKQIGRLKNFACANADGDIFFEMDADDLLAPTALERCVEAFSDKSVVFAYSNTLEFEDKTWKQGEGYLAFYGWQYRDCVFMGRKLREAISWPPNPQAFRRVLWSSNHYRAWRKSAYNMLGGHDPKLPMGDDFDLICRTAICYGFKAMRHIDEPLYGYRVHGNNTVITDNAELQQWMNKLYVSHVEALFVKWAQEEGLLCVDVSDEFSRPQGDKYIKSNCNSMATDIWFAASLYDYGSMPTGLYGTTGVIRAKHCIQKLDNPIQFFNTAYNALAPGGLLMLEVPSVVGVDGKSVGLGAFRDPRSKTFWSAKNFDYYTRRQFARFIQPEYTGRFQESRIETWNLEEGCPVVTVELLALKPGYQERHAGEVHI